MEFAYIIIEAESEVPISWAEVSANSGGEGFLSAFVILSSLLNYMRRDETDIFAIGEEGKVLIMDNPFAQTNAEHLLKPLTDMAKKTNTQLICLSGIGGDSVYNRFDNIYVLKLVSSSMKKEMQYLKGNHTKEMIFRKWNCPGFMWSRAACLILWRKHHKFGGIFESPLLKIYKKLLLNLI